MMATRGPRCVEENVITLQQAYSVIPMSPPVDATAQQKRDFYRERAAMFDGVAKTDRDRYYEATACAELEREKANQFQPDAEVP